METHRIGAVLLLAAAACGPSIDARTESARTLVLALDAADASRIVAFCKSQPQDGALRLDESPPALPAPTSASAAAGVITFAWWNNSHAEEDEPHPGFELICSDRAVTGAKALAAGLWYRDTPMNQGD